MKKMTCKQLGGACELVFEAETFEEMATLSKQHGTEMYKAADPAHLEAMGEMQKMMHTPEEMQKWMQGKKDLFDSLPHF